MTDPERRAHALDRRKLIPRDGGRRATDTKGPIMPDAKPELDRLAAAAASQGRTHLEGICRLALAHITALEQEILRIRGNAGAGAQTRLLRMTPAQRSLIASTAAKRRWDAHG